MLTLDLDQALTLATLGLLAGFLVAALAGWRQLQSARELSYFMLRRQRIAQGWRMLLIGGGFGVLALALQLFGRPLAYAINPPTATPTASPTVTSTPSITPTASVTPTPSITPTASVTPTPTITSTPLIPEEIRVLLRETVTPNPEAAFSAIQVATRLDGGNQPINPAQEFRLPLGRLYGAFSYNNLQDGVRWTALWYRGDQVVCLETMEWDGGTGGYGYTECEPEGGWLPGEYEIRIFWAETWKVSAHFTVLGEPSATPTSRVTPTP